MKYLKELWQSLPVFFQVLSWWVAGLAISLLVRYIFDVIMDDIENNKKKEA